MRGGPPAALAKRLRTPSRRRWDKAERATVALAATALSAAGVVIADQYGRMLRRRVRQPEEEVPGSVSAVAAADTVGVAVEGYQAAGRTETVLFNMLSGFLGAFAFVRLGTWGIRDSWWPWGNVRLGDRHIHHFVPGILTAFGAGTVALLTDNEKLEEHLAIPMGAGMGLTFDEAALLLDLRDVYWSREGLLSLQLTFGTTATLSAAIILIRMLRRGEQRQEAAGAIPAPAHPSHHPPPFPV